MSEREELIKLLTEARKDVKENFERMLEEKWFSKEAMERSRERQQKLLSDIDSALTAQQSQQEPTEPVAKYGGRRKSPDGTNECWAFLLCKPEFDPPEGAKLYTAPLSGVRAGMLRAAEICKEWEGKLSQGAGYAIRTAREAITRAADQPDQPDQPDTRPGTPLMLTMETLDLWHQIIHDESLERGDRLQRIAARINVIQDSVKRAADQVKQSIDTPSMYELMDYPAPVDDSVYSEKGWLIEIGESSYNDLRYQTMINGVRAWTESSEDALRFCRRQDAEKFAAASSLKCRIAEHVWHGKAADQVADQPADAVVVPLDLIKRIDDALGAFTGDEELLNSHIDTYNDVREIRAAQEGK